jgi:hypothetical protein
MKKLKNYVFSFDEYKSKIYLATNFAANYAMLVQIFNEVRS